MIAKVWATVVILTGFFGALLWDRQYGQVIYGLFFAECIITAIAFVWSM